MKYDKNFDQLSEAYLKIPSRRLFYPRNFNLSETFLQAFNEEYSRHLNEGQDPKKCLAKFQKALRFTAEDCRVKFVKEQQAKKKIAESHDRKKSKDKAAHDKYRHN